MQWSPEDQKEERKKCRISRFERKNWTIDAIVLLRVNTCHVIGQCEKCCLCAKASNSRTHSWTFCTYRTRIVIQLNECAAAAYIPRPLPFVSVNGAPSCIRTQCRSRSSLSSHRLVSMKISIFRWQSGIDLRVERIDLNVTCDSALVSRFYEFVKINEKMSCKSPHH